jgi:hypothetical protein
MLGTAVIFVRTFVHLSFCMKPFGWLVSDVICNIKIYAKTKLHFHSYLSVMSKDEGENYNMASFNC